MPKLVHAFSWKICEPGSLDNPFRRFGDSEMIPSREMISLETGALTQAVYEKIGCHPSNGIFPQGKNLRISESPKET